MMQTAVKTAAAALAGIVLLFGGLMSFLSTNPPKDLSEDLQQMQQDLGFAQIGGAGWFRPCEYLALTSEFGWRTNPITGESGNFHNGVDLANDEGTPIYAAKNGRVIQVSQIGGYGHHVRIEHEGRFTTLYAHMQRYIVKEGQEVSGGQLIGYMGSTGNSTGPHLHFSVFNGSEYVDPMLYISDSALSVDQAQRQIYDYLTGQMGLNAAAASGILANIEKESAFDPNALGDNGTSFGICQWHDTSEDLAKRSGCGIATAQKAIKELTVHGYVERENNSYYSLTLGRRVYSKNTYRMVNIPGSYTLLPRTALRRRGKRGGAHASFSVLLYLYRCAGRVGRAFPSLRQMANKAKCCGASKASVCCALQMLKQENTVIRTECRKMRGDLSCNSYFLTDMVIAGKRLENENILETQKTEGKSEFIGGLKFSKLPRINKITRDYILRGKEYCVFQFGEMHKNRGFTVHVPEYENNGHGIKIHPLDDLSELSV